MNANDMMKALRLTQHGRLKEAVSVIQSAVGATMNRDPKTEANEPEPKASDVLDMLPPREVGGAWTSPKSHNSSFRQAPQTERFNLDESVLKIRDQIGKTLHVRGSDSWRAHAPTQKTPRARPTGARFETRTFANESGSRAYKIYIPSSYVGDEVPLVIMLHGCTQSPDDFAAGTRMNEVAEEQTFLVVYPEQNARANQSKCWNWFSVADQGRGKGEAALIAGITREIMRDFAVDARRVYIAGLSAGGAAAANIGAAYPDVYAAVGVHSGLPCGAASDLPSALKAMRDGARVKAAKSETQITIPTIVFHGDRDRTVNVANAELILAQSRAGAKLKTSVGSGETSGGVKYTRNVRAERDGRPMLEQWIIHGAGHAWSGGSVSGSYTDPLGPDASREFVRFFLQHQKGGAKG
jgi:poly(hydroxyalkanoate) depolymerase family esterase